MTRLSITVDPMPALRQASEDSVDVAFNAMAAHAAHLEAAHAQKRQWAATKYLRLQAEADLRGMTLEALASEILSKPDELAAFLTTQPEPLAIPHRIWCLRATV